MKTDAYGAGRWQLSGPGQMLQIHKLELDDRVHWQCDTSLWPLTTRATALCCVWVSSAQGVRGYLRPEEQQRWVVAVGCLQGWIVVQTSSSAHRIPEAQWFAQVLRQHGYPSHSSHPGHIEQPVDPGHPGDQGHAGHSGHPGHPDHPGQQGHPGHPQTSPAAQDTEPSRGRKDKHTDTEAQPTTEAPGMSPASPKRILRTGQATTRDHGATLSWADRTPVVPERAATSGPPEAPARRSWAPRDQELVTLGARRWPSHWLLVQRLAYPTTRWRRRTRMSADNLSPCRWPWRTERSDRPKRSNGSERFERSEHPLDWETWTMPPCAPESQVQSPVPPTDSSRSLSTEDRQPGMSGRGSRTLVASPGGTDLTDLDCPHLAESQMSSVPLARSKSPAANAALHDPWEQLRQSVHALHLEMDDLDRQLDRLNNRCSSSAALVRRLGVPEVS